MLDGTDLLNAIKKAALDAVNTTQPSDFCYGEVVSVKPLKIFIEQKLTLGSAQLVLTRNVTDFTTTVTVNWDSEFKSGGVNAASFESHNHQILGTKKLTIHNALQKGDKVVLLKQKGGQKYLVLDRVVNA